MLKKMLFLLPLLAASTALAQAPMGLEFQVNSYTDGVQFVPAVVRRTGGEFVVVWSSYGSGGNDASGFSVQGQRFASDGIVIGSEFQVNTNTTSDQLFPAIDMTGGGDFVVVWTSYWSGGDGSGSSIQSQRYASDGSLSGAQFQVNSYTTGFQFLPAVTTDSGGGFVIVWASQGSAVDSSGLSVQGRRYASDGSPFGGEFQVNSYTTNDQRDPSVDSSDDGFVVAWAGGIGGIETDIFARRFSSSAVPLGSDFQVNSYTTQVQGNPSVAASSAGDFVIVWESDGQDGDGYGINSQRFDASGSPVSTEFQINSFTTSDQRCAFVSANPQGMAFQVDGYDRDGAEMGSSFVVVWKSDGPDGDGLGISGRRFNFGGTPSGSEFQVNSHTTGDQSYPALAGNADGDFVVVWSSELSSGPDQDTSIQGQRFLFIAEIFSDGFESGDTSAWSSEVP